MSWCDVYSYWRCPSCESENKYNLTWQHFYVFKEIPDERYSKEKCAYCGKECYVNDKEPNPFCFRMDRGKCKNDYVKDMVIDTNENLTIGSEHFTS